MKTIACCLSFLCGHRRRLPFAALMWVIGLASSNRLMGQEKPNELTAVRPENSRSVLTEDEWKAVETAVDNGLEFLGRQHRPDGTFQNVAVHDPAITSLCLMAFLSRGHLPRNGVYGEQLDTSARFVLKCQQPNGMISHRNHIRYSAYSHGISALLLSELYGMSPSTDEVLFREGIEKAIKFTSTCYPQPKRQAHDEGSWRYLDHSDDNDGDLSVTSWNVMFLRSAKNSGFEVDVKLIDDSVKYTKSLFNPERKTFRYMYTSHFRSDEERRGMAGAGILSLSLSGEYHSEQAKTTAGFLLSQPFDNYERPVYPGEFICYAAFYASHGMFQMGGDYWNEFYPKLVKATLKCQSPNGSWSTPQTREVGFGPAYMTALTILALTPPYQMLPIFQR